jgi:hypothetical protein
MIYDSKFSFSIEYYKIIRNIQLIKLNYEGCSIDREYLPAFCIKILNNTNNTSISNIEYVDNFYYVNYTLIVADFRFQPNRDPRNYLTYYKTKKRLLSNNYANNMFNPSELYGETYYSNGGTIFKFVNNIPVILCLLAIKSEIVLSSMSYSFIGKNYLKKLQEYTIDKVKDAKNYLLYINNDMSDIDNKVIDVYLKHCNDCNFKVDRFYTSNSLLNMFFTENIKTKFEDQEEMENYSNYLKNLVFYAEV